MVEVAFIEGRPHIRGGRYERFHCIIAHSKAYIIICLLCSSGVEGGQVHVCLTSLLRRAGQLRGRRDPVQ